MSGPPVQSSGRNVTAFRSKGIVFTIKRGAVRYKALQIVFAADGGFFVTFPYFRHRTGLLSKATIPANGRNESMVSLEHGGKISSHLVKYSHHPDGEAHFSGDGKIRTEVRRRSVALGELKGHIFTAVLQGLGGFVRAIKKRDEQSVSPGRTVLTFDIGSDDRDVALKFVGRWFHVDAINPSDALLTTGPMVVTKDRDGQLRAGAVLASPLADTEHVLIVTCEEIPRLGPQPEMLLFYGGFDAPAIMNDTSREAGFLAFRYPVDEPEELRLRLGTVDYCRAMGTIPGTPAPDAS